MARSYVFLLVLLAALWGASFMFIKIALEGFEPTTMMFLRLLFSAVPLLAIVVYTIGRSQAWRQLRRVTGPAIVLGIVNTALPFTLIAWGETRIDSGIAAVANASMPIFVAILAFRYRASERATGLRLFGVVLGLIGVGVLAGVRPEGGWAGALGTLAVVAASISYAVGTLYTQGILDDVRNDVLAAASITWGAVWLAPFGALQAPAEMPSWAPWLAVLGLALGGTVVGQLIYFRLIYDHGSARASLVVYLLPVTALLYGTLLLDEPLTIAAVVGLALILAGTALGSGLVRVPRRRGQAVAAAP